MLHLLRRYTHWLHTRWPAGTVERLPEVREDGSTAVPGLYVVGDLTGIPLLKFSADSGARAVQTIAADPQFQKERAAGGLDLAIVGGGVSGMAAALEARKLGLSFEVLEASEPFSTLVNFPKRKPIYAYPTQMRPAGELEFKADVKEPLVEELLAQTAAIATRKARVERIARSGGGLELQLAGAEPLRARRAIVAIGRAGNFRKLGVPGEESGKVFNRLHDPKEFAGQRVLVVGGGDSALESAIALCDAGAQVTLSYRGAELARPKPENQERLAALGEQIARRPASRVQAIEPGEVRLALEGGREERLPNDVVFALIGREAPLEFFRKSGVPIRGEYGPKNWIALALILAAAFLVYHWKKTGVYFGIGEAFQRKGWFPYGVPAWWESLGGAFADKHTLLGTLKITLGEPGFYYSLVYCVIIALFGWKRVRRRNTPYVRLQTISLAVVQIVPLFLLPYVILPWMGNNGLFDHGALASFADTFFPRADYGHGREYWRAFGFVLAWPLFFWNVFTEQPMWGWLALSLFQTFVVIPLIVRKWGKGAYCGWICSCGALAETLGDTQRSKMPHGPRWNRLNMIGQVFLALAFVLLVSRSLAWAFPSSPFGAIFDFVFKKAPVFNYVWFVDLLWAGIIGVGFYWHFSGRVWCRFACPLAALMHIYARFTRFRILSEKKKCISCNVCTSVCHQGIDVMNFANKGLPMADPECVRCSACVSSCPTGVLAFGEIDPATGEELRRDKLAASAVQMAESGR
ncbi:MAG: NAD(P)-binding domain-containing protein [Planctomycetes bacterium]|nr:NAD(P)-binding domain-containing protein [Planctomycetota bacterium]